MVQKLDEYYKEIEKGLECLPDIQHRVLNDLKVDVENYIFKHPTATIEEIQAHFGSPEKFIEDNAGIKSEKDLVKPKRVKKTVFCVLSIVAIDSAGILIYGIFDGSKSNQGHFSDGAGVGESMIHDDSWTTTALEAAE